MRRDEPLPPTAERVPRHTAQRINRRIRHETEATLTHCAEHPDEIDRRLQELDREWDIERTLEANAATVSLVGLGLATAHNRRWLVVPTGVAAFLLQHALQGWCPPVSVFRRLGVRTAAEIDRERYALRYLRGDFGAPPPAESPAAERGRRALAAAEGWPQVH